MKQKASKTDYFVKIALMIVGGVVLAFFMSAHIWNIIHREEKLAYTIDYIEEVRLDFGEEKSGKFRFERIYYQVLFADGSRWGGLENLHSENWKGVKEKLHAVLAIDTTSIEDRIPLQIDSKEFKHISENEILAIRSEKKGWELLKIGDGYLVNSGFTTFELVLLYLVLCLFIAIGIFAIAAAIYLVIKDTSGFKNTKHLSYIPGKWDGLMYVMRGFRHEKKGRQEGGNIKKTNNLNQKH